LWSEKYRPQSLEEMVGNEEARAKLLAWLRRWKRGEKAALLVGPPGTGKTTTVHLVAEKLGLQLVELNASDTRTKDKLSRRMGELVGSANLFGTGSLIFLDEVDGLAGRSDYGAIDYIRDAVRRSTNPVVMAANDPDSDEVKKLASVTRKIEFVRPAPEEVEHHLSKIAKKEGSALGSAALASIVQAANGDIRSAVNFLQAGGPARKDEELTAAQSVDEFLAAHDMKSALSAIRAYPGQPREKLRDLLVAVARARVLEERRANALDALSRADVLLGRIMRGKDWRLLRYLDQMLASDVWSALGDGGARYTLDSVPWPLQVRIWNDSRRLREIGLLEGRRTGISQKGALVEDIPFIALLSRDRKFREALVHSLDLDEGYAEFLSKEAARSGRPQL
jgi:replication factor C large subunit